jgi:hypothetical protein
MLLDYLPRRFRTCVVNDYDYPDLISDGRKDTLNMARNLVARHYNTYDLPTRAAGEFHQESMIRVYVLVTLSTWTTQV